MPWYDFEKKEWVYKYANTGALKTDASSWSSYSLKTSSSGQNGNFSDGVAEDEEKESISGP